MSVTQARFDVIARNRRVYLSTPDGRAALRELLRSCLIFIPPEEWLRLAEEDPKWSVTKLVQGLCLLESLGVVIEENFDRLIAKMAELPMPIPDAQERNDNGET